MNWYVSEAAMEAADIGRELKKAWRLRADSAAESEYAASGSVCCFASELLGSGRSMIPDWVDAETRFLVIRDVPVSATTKIPSILRLHRPDQRLFLTDDADSVRRWMIAVFREAPFDGIIDAYLWNGLLVGFLGDLSIREFPAEQIPSLQGLSTEERGCFEVDVDGSYLHWPASDVHLGPSQILHAVDPSKAADIEFERYPVENTAAALKHMRKQRGLTQTEITGLSDRQVSRLENGRSRLAADAAAKWAAAFDMDLDAFLTELGALLSYWKNKVAGESEDDRETALSEVH